MKRKKNERHNWFNYCHATRVTRYLRGFGWLPQDALSVKILSLSVLQ